MGAAAERSAISENPRRAGAENNSQVVRNGRELILLQNLSFGFSVFQRFSFALCR
jgi:hypothetical protein